jgi:UDP-N-acetylglucosamine 2-epimerase (non-hydrolysing)
MRILAIYGTRPEFIKIKPIIDIDKSIKTLFVKQHTNIIDFGNSDFSLEIENSCVSRINSIFSEIFRKLELILNNFDSILIQGDTATVMASALVAFHSNKKIIYIESGLRSFDLQNPFPEEGYRQMVSRIVDINFCPTELSASNLKKENVKGEIYVVGNTCLDNIISYKDKTSYSDKVLVTLHRNENLSIIKDWLTNISEVASIHTNLKFVMPVHPNPIIKKACEGINNIEFLDPLSHKDLLNLMKDCLLIITDSGGIQEEGCFLNKKVIVCRKTTERPEGIETGHINLCKSPNDFSDIFEHCFENYYIDSQCPYGDGKSSEKIIKIINKKNLDETFKEC